MNDNKNDLKVDVWIGLTVAGFVLLLAYPIGFFVFWSNFMQTGGMDTRVPVFVATVFYLLGVILYYAISPILPFQARISNISMMRTVQLMGLVAVWLACLLFLILVDYKSYLNMDDLRELTAGITQKDLGDDCQIEVDSAAEGRWISAHLVYKPKDLVFRAGINSTTEVISVSEISEIVVLESKAFDVRYALRWPAEPYLLYDLYFFSLNKSEKVVLPHEKKCGQ